MSTDLHDHLNSVAPGAVYRNVALDELSHWKIGGRAAALVRPRTPQEVSAVLRAMNDRSEPCVTIGATTNILFDSEGFDGVLLQIGDELSTMRIDGRYVHAGAGVSVPDLVHAAAVAGLTGIEHAAGIPGTVGGLVLMNGGTQRKGIGAHVEKLSFVDALGVTHELTGEDLDIGYRHTALQGRRGAVCDVTFELSHGDGRAGLENIASITAERAAKFPLELPSCGSTFLSDPAMYAEVGPPGKAIEDAGLKGVISGRAQISPRHANFIVNLGGATSEDVLSLIALARQAVFVRTGYEMNCEVRYLTRDGNVMPAHAALS